MQTLADHYSKELKELKNNNDNSIDTFTVSKSNSVFKLQHSDRKCKKVECKPEFKLVDLDKK